MVPITTRFETDDLDAAHAAVRAGLALGVLPDVGIYLVYPPTQNTAFRPR